MGKLYLFIFFLFSCNSSCENLPQQKARWATDPIVINCVDSPYSELEVRRALSFWEDLGYKFSFVWDNFDCSGPLIPGAIEIDIAHQGITSRALGETKTKYNEKKEIYYSEIEIAVKEDLVLEHEIGHALGWEHYYKEGHIMYPKRNKAGLDGSGMEKV